MAGVNTVYGLALRRPLTGWLFFRCPTPDQRRTQPTPSCVPHRWQRGFCIDQAPSSPGAVNAQTNSIP